MMMMMILIALVCFTNAVIAVGERGAVVVARPALRQFVTAIESLSNADVERVARFALDSLKPRAMHYGDELVPLARLLAEVCQAGDRFLEAAKIMAAVDLSAARNTSGAFRAEWFVSAAEMFNAAADTVSASSLVSLAHREMSEVTDPIVMLRFKTLHAMICDAERKFLEATHKYMELSQMAAGGLVSEEMILKSLENAVTCAILAKAGPSRSRLLATLYRDERASRLPNYRILEKMYKERILRAAEVEKFEETLQPHQRATLAGGVTVLKAAVNEHNMLAASKIYKNIKIDELAGLLNLSPDAAEQVACRMITESRLKASVNQIDGVVDFENDAETFAVWDEQVGGVCLAVNAAVERLPKRVDI